MEEKTKVILNAAEGYSTPSCTVYTIKTKTCILQGSGGTTGGGDTPPGFEPGGGC